MNTGMQLHAMGPVIHDGPGSGPIRLPGQRIVANLCGLWKTTQPEKVLHVVIEKFIVIVTLFVAVLLFSCCCLGLCFLSIELLNHVGVSLELGQLLHHGRVGQILVHFCTQSLCYSYLGGHHRNPNSNTEIILLAAITG